jgi:predicted ester cyclase
MSRAWCGRSWLKWWTKVSKRACCCRTLADGRHTIDEAFDVGVDRAALRGVFQGTHTNAFMGIPPTGTRVRVTFMNLDRFAGGKLVEHRAQVDMLGLMPQLGVVPS